MMSPQFRRNKHLISLWRKRLALNTTKKAAARVVSPKSRRFTTEAQRHRGTEKGKIKSLAADERRSTQREGLSDTENWEPRTVLNAVWANGRRPPRMPWSCRLNLLNRKP